MEGGRLMSGTWKVTSGGGGGGLLVIGAVILLTNRNTFGPALTELVTAVAEIALILGALLIVAAAAFMVLLGKVSRRENEALTVYREQMAADWRAKEEAREQRRTRALQNTAPQITNHFHVHGSDALAGLLGQQQDTRIIPGHAEEVPR
jgi:hypothetical protein